jgi:hypothetical protein
VGRSVSARTCSKQNATPTRAAAAAHALDATLVDVALDAVRVELGDDVVALDAVRVELTDDHALASGASICPTEARRPDPNFSVFLPERGDVPVRCLRADLSTQLRVGE